MMYIGKMWFEELLPLKTIADKFKLEGVKAFKTEDVIGTMRWRGTDILVTLHLSWGLMAKSEKIRIYVHHLKEEEQDELFGLLLERVKNIVKEKTSS